MIKKSKLIIILFLLSNKLLASDVTYLFSGGRFGDNVIAYLHTKWVAKKHDLQFKYRPFPYAEQLALHYKEPIFNEQGKYEQVISVTDQTRFIKDKNYLYVIPHFPESKFEYEQYKGLYPFYCTVDWNDKEFISEVRANIQPVRKLNLLNLPKDRICVALHVRKGGGYDTPLTADGYYPEEGKTTPFDIVFPLKFPPDSFFVEQLKIFSESVNHKPIYAYIFTDDQNPKRLVDKYAAELNLPNITFDYRGKNNHHTANVLEDFFSLAQFHVLIRGESSFSIVASLLTKNQLVIYPTDVNYNPQGAWKKNIPDVLNYKEAHYQFNTTWGRKPIQVTKYEWKKNS
ncbi:TPA: hypothetical protein DIC20_04580 [Candidatus Dependentiae bacterium]|nr:MAG: hypothetical protein US03_C0011G0016 [candidate division TM6 bacterium GW2011_GWF2_36_131]KKQ02644.1 MAG: hypothetical protein US13_C0012G0022 [candidate division TM6 bacterium GW2011_GWE2_36_25]HBR70276.1 hypothetical protein [Candidatus Dependentiae bacterium]HCU00952.1 hypothetical protein [Candidatus Dependentiae bacterium]